MKLLDLMILDKEMYIDRNDFICKLVNGILIFLVIIGIITIIDFFLPSNSESIEKELSPKEIQIIELKKELEYLKLKTEVETLREKNQDTK